MEEICGVAVHNATMNDIQRWMKCNSTISEDCNYEGLEYPKTCSCPPCNQCFSSCNGEL